MSSDSESTDDEDVNDLILDRLLISDTVLSHKEAGDVFFLQGNYDSSIKEYKAALGLIIIETSDDESLREELTQRLAESYKWLGCDTSLDTNCVEALKYFRKAAKLNPTDYQNWLSISLCYYRLGEYGEMKDAAQTAIENNPSDLRGYTQLAKAQSWHLFEFHDAEEIIEEGLAIDPNNSQLLELQSSNNNIIDFRSHFQSGVLQYPDQGYYEFFGGLHQAQAADKIPADSTYAKLPRPAKSRLVEKIWSTVLKDGNGNENEDRSSDELTRHALFSVFCNQDLPVKWFCSEYEFRLEGYVPEDEIHPVIQCLFSASGETEKEFIFEMTTFQNQAFHNSMRSEDKERLMVVLISRFLRSMGSFLPKVWLLRCFNGVLTPILMQWEKFNRLADLDIVKCDVLINCHDLPACRIYDLCESLNASGMYVEAGKLFSELADGKYGNLEWNFPDMGKKPHLHYFIGNLEWNFPKMGKMPHLHFMAAKSFEFGMSYVDAEREFLAYARDVGPAIWDEDSSENFRAVLYLYSCASEAFSLHLVPHDTAHMAIQRSYLLLIALLSNTGVSSESFSAIDSAMLRSIKTLVRPKFKSAQKSKKALNSVFATKSVDDFHKLLFSYQSPDRDCPDIPVKITRQEFLTEQKGKAKEMSIGRTLHNKKLKNEDYDTAGLTWGATDTNCGHCQRLNHSDFEVCPCGKVVYCSKDCQVAHRPIHKKICTTRKR